MRVGIDAVPFAYEQTGIWRYLGSVLEEMQALDASVEYVLYSPLPVVVPLRKGNWRVRTASRSLAQRPSIWMQAILPSLLATDKVDAFWGQPTNLPICMRHRCFRVLTIHDLVPYVRPESMRFRTWLRMRLLLGPAARAADAVIAVSQATADLAFRYLGIEMDRLHVVYEAAHSAFRPVPTDQARAAVSAEFGLPPRYILCVCTIEPRKDHLTLLRALAAVPHAPLLVLAGGMGWRCEHIMAQIRAHEQVGRVRYLGRVDDAWLSVLYSGAVLSVYPSLYEGFGLPVLEAMSCGCPVLCSDSSSLPEVGGAAARYFRTGDAMALSAGLRELLDSQSVLDAMSEAGLARARLFSFRRAAQQLLEIVREGVARQRR